MTDTTPIVGTLDLAPGDVVQRVGSMSLLRVTEIREPSHALAHGLVVVGHLYRSGLMYWSPREHIVHDWTVSEQWYVWQAEDVPVANVLDNGEGWSVVSTEDGVITVNQHMIESDYSRFWRVWPLSYQLSDALARRYLPGARLVSSTGYGVTSATRDRRVYRVPSEV